MKNIDSSEKKTKKSCFIITPVGDDDSDIRIEANGIIEAVVKPILEEEYNILAAHMSIASVVITKEIINSIYNADLVIANLTNSNPNVMYELSLAHALRKPVVHLIREGQKPPFDISSQRYISYTNNLYGAVKLKEQLKSFVDEVTKPDAIISNPITDSIDNISVSAVDRETSVSKFIDLFDARLGNLERILNRERINLYDSRQAISKTNRQKVLMALVDFLNDNNLSMDDLKNDDNLLRHASNQIMISDSYLRMLLNEITSRPTGSPL